MQTILIAQTEEWNAMLKFVSDIVDQATMDYTKEGLKVSAWDPSNVAIVTAWINKAAFVEYTIKKARIVCDIQQISKYCERAGKDGILRIEFSDRPDPSSMKITLNGIRAYEINGFTKEASKDTFEYDATTGACITDTDSITLVAETLKDARAVDPESIGISMAEGCLKVSAKGTTTKYHSSIPITDQMISAAEDRDDMVGMSNQYGPDYLKQVEKLLKNAEHLRMTHKGQNTPLKWEVKIAQNYQIDYVIAPRAE